MAIDLESLRVLSAVVAEGSFAKAAEKLNKTQSAVSYQIQKLEQRLGTDLFDRSAYRAELTPVGERILAEGERLLHQARHVSALVDQFSAGWEPRLELVVDGMMPGEEMLGVLKEMVELNIPTHIQLRVEYLGGVQQRFEQDNAELMLALEYEPDNQLLVHALHPVETVLVVSAEHELADMRNITLDTLQQHVELTVHDSSYNKAYGGWQTFGGERVFYLSDFRAKLEAIAIGLGYGWMPLDKICQQLNGGQLKELDYQGGSRHLYTPVLVRRRDRPLGRAGQWLSDQLLERFG
ncbi:LysR family transcriptional regulator [Oceanospirillum sediminis]|uniref:LysR family transcriptional regulator n=1 Tax=Oceanospirillum sediminis TaxID=2760088 RepID=A0A839IPI8_9GAMM|nr:LysR family transcriptional regulator [Oceanospirillum sediminis]MBB1486367.1 LysR family transcriptional regulator [Oceanospirillum sediminis]